MGKYIIVDVLSFFSVLEAPWLKISRTENPEKDYLRYPQETKETIEFLYSEGYQFFGIYEDPVMSAISIDSKEALYGKNLIKHLLVTVLGENNTCFPNENLRPYDRGSYKNSAAELYNKLEKDLSPLYSFIFPGTQDNSEHAVISALLNKFAKIKKENDAGGASALNEKLLQINGEFSKKDQSLLSSEKTMSGEHPLVLTGKTISQKIRSNSTIDPSKDRVNGDNEVICVFPENNNFAVLCVESYDANLVVVPTTDSNAQHPLGKPQAHLERLKNQDWKSSPLAKTPKLKRRGSVGTGVFKTETLENYGIASGEPGDGSPKPSGRRKSRRASTFSMEDLRNSGIITDPIETPPSPRSKPPAPTPKEYPGANPDELGPPPMLTPPPTLPGVAASAAKDPSVTSSASSTLTPPPALIPPPTLTTPPLLNTTDPGGVSSVAGSSPIPLAPGISGNTSPPLPVFTLPGQTNSTTTEAVTAPGDTNTNTNPGNSSTFFNEKGGTTETKGGDETPLKQQKPSAENSVTAPSSTSTIRDLAKLVNQQPKPETVQEVKADTVKRVAGAGMSDALAQGIAQRAAAVRYSIKAFERAENRHRDDEGNVISTTDPLQAGLFTKLSSMRKGIDDKQADKSDDESWSSDDEDNTSPRPGQQ